MPERIAILGAGSWGLAIARLLELNGHDLTMWEFDRVECERLRELRTIPEKLPGFSLAESVNVTSDLAQAYRDADLIVLAVPAQVTRSVLAGIGSSLPPETGLVNLAKGIEAGTLCRISEVAVQETKVPLERFATLSGPSHAEEVMKDMPTTVVAASLDNGFAERVQSLFARPTFRVYQSADLIGVEYGGALKNIIAIAAGIASGLDFGDNTMGALLTRGLTEMARLGVAAGANAETFAGLSGLGDLVTTCISRHSRNRQVGQRIAAGEKLDQIVGNMAMVAEGVETTRSGYKLAKKFGVEMPITSEVYKVLFENKPAIEALENLMGRALKAEAWN